MPAKTKPVTKKTAPPRALLDAARRYRDENRKRDENSIRFFQRRVAEAEGPLRFTFCRKCKIIEQDKPFCRNCGAHMETYEEERGAK